MAGPLTHLQFGDIDTARAARGVRMAVSGAVPSPWSEAAKGIFHVKQLPALAVRFRPGDPALEAWSRSHNVPAVMNDDEPSRTGWAEILALAERLGGAASLVPAGVDARARLFGMANELAGEGGLGWCGRLVMIEASLASGGVRGFPVPVAQRLAAKYGYAPERLPAARARIVEVLGAFDHLLAASRAAGHDYLMGPVLTALDIYLATFLTPFVALPEADCPRMAAPARPAYASLHEQMGPAVPPALVAHRRLVFDRHLPWPIEL